MFGDAGRGAGFCPSGWPSCHLTSRSRSRSSWRSIVDAVPTLRPGPRLTGLAGPPRPTLHDVALSDSWPRRSRWSCADRTFQSPRSGATVDAARFDRPRRRRIAGVVRQRRRRHALYGRPTAPPVAAPQHRPPHRPGPGRLPPRRLRRRPRFRTPTCRTLRRANRPRRPTLLPPHTARRSASPDPRRADRCAATAGSEGRGPRDPREPRAHRPHPFDPAASCGRRLHRARDRSALGGGWHSALPSEGDATAALGNASSRANDRRPAAGLDELQRGTRRQAGGDRLLLRRWHDVAAARCRRTSLSAAVPFYGPAPPTPTSAAHRRPRCSVYGELDPGQRPMETARAALEAAGLVTRSACSQAPITLLQRHRPALQRRRCGGGTRRCSTGSAATSPCKPRQPTTPGARISGDR